MIPGTRNILTLMMIAGIAWGLVFISACDEPRNEPVSAPKPKVVSKQISQPVPAAAPKKADVPGSMAAGNAKTPNAEAIPVTEAQIKREQADAQAQEAARKQTEAQIQTDAKNPAEVQEPAKVQSAVPLFRSQETYDFKGRVDPFIPLISTRKEAAPAADAKEEIPKRVLTPLEKMELSQIRLVAVLQTTKGTIAMVEEASGKGYEVRVGTYIGRNGGRVSAINSDGLTVKEFYTDYQGKRRERVEEVKFHKNEGGE